MWGRRPNTRAVDRERAPETSFLTRTPHARLGGGPLQSSRPDNSRDSQTGLEMVHVSINQSRETIINKALRGS